MYKVTLARKIVEGEIVLVGEFKGKIVKTEKARGRKPRQGENLVFFTRNKRLTINSLAPVRVWRGA